MKYLHCLAALVLALVLTALPLRPAAAQSNSILVVPSCGSQSLHVGATLGVLTVDTSGISASPVRPRCLAERPR